MLLNAVLAPLSIATTASAGVIASVATADGHIILAVGNDAQFRRFC